MFTTTVDDDPAPSAPAPVSGSGRVDFVGLLSAVDGIGEGALPFDVVQGLKDLQTLSNHIEGRQDELIRALHDCYAAGNIAKLEEPWRVEERVRAEDVADRQVRVEVEAAYGLSRGRAQTLVHNAHYLGLHPTLAMEVTSGRLERSKAHIIYFAMRGLSNEAHRRHVVDTVLPGAGRKTHGALQREVEDLVLQLDPKASQERHKERVKRRGVKISGVADSGADVTIYNLPADQAVDAYNTLDHDARAVKKAGDKRGLNQIRADLAVARITGRAVVVECDGTNCGHDRSGCECTRNGPCGCGCGRTYARNHSDSEGGAVEDTSEPAHSHGENEDTDQAGDTDQKPSTSTSGCKHSTSPTTGSAPRSKGPSLTLMTIPLDRIITLTAQHATRGNGPGVVPHQRGNSSGADVPHQTSTSGTGSGDGWASGPTDPEQTGITQASIPGYGEVSNQPAWLAGFGPLLDTIAYRMLQAALRDPDARVAVAITHPVTGRLMQYHPIDKRYLRGLEREAMHAAYSECLFLTCSIPAIICDGDHRVPFEKVRETHADNMNPLCPSHHTTKSTGGFQLDPMTPGEWQLKMRSGHTYTTTTPPLTTPPIDPENDPPPF